MISAQKQQQMVLNYMVAKFRSHFHLLDVFLLELMGDRETNIEVISIFIMMQKKLKLLRKIRVTRIIKFFSSS